MKLIMRLILASQSPRRQELLAEAGFEFDVQPSHIEELLLPGELAEEFACRIAREKALVVAASANPGNLILGADTVVARNGQILGKPCDHAEAVEMLRTLSGATHRVTTGICVVRAPASVEAWTHETTLVTFRELDAGEIEGYVASGEPFDKAGGYAIQGLASRFVTRIEGCYFNVVGLPVPRVYEIIKSISRREEALRSQAHPRP
jgi:septum formation protein